MPGIRQDNLDAALFWHGAGFTIFPIKAGTKEPRFEGYQSARMNADDIRSHWTKYPDDRAGLLCNRVFTLDVDTKDGRDGRPWLEASRHLLPATFEVATPSGGTHLLFLIPEGVAIPNDTRGKLAVGVDVKANGIDGGSPGYVVAAGSDGYRGRNSLSIASAPQWLIDLVARPLDACMQSGKHATPITPPERLKSELQRHCANVAALAPGEQQHGFSLAAIHVGSLVRDGLDEAQAVEALVAAGMTMTNEPGREPWAASDLRKLAVSKIAKGRANPVRTVADVMGAAPLLPGMTASARSVPSPSAIPVPREAAEYLRSFTNEAGAADLFALASAGRFRYVSDADAWFAWDGMRWAPDANGSSVLAAIVAWLKAVALTDPSCAVTPRADWKKLQTAAMAKNVRTILGGLDGIATKAIDFDADRMALNTPVGIVDLRTGAISPHDPARMMTKITAVAPAATATAPLWDHVVNHACRGDREFVEYLRKVFAYALTGDISFEQLFFLHGDGGSGKGTILNTMIAAIGPDYATVADADTFLESRAPRHLEDIADLRDARAVIVQEMPMRAVWDSKRIKSLTGGDTIKARGLYASRFSFLPQMTLIIASNHKPRIRDVDESIRRRLRVLPFTNAVPEAERDTSIKLRLMEEREGILRWAIDGLAALWRDGLNPPQVVIDATADYIEDQDTVSAWVAESCEPDQPGSWTQSSAAHANYVEYVRSREASEESPLSIKEFGVELEKRGFRKERRTPGQGFVGLRLRPRVLTGMPMAAIMPGMGNVIRMPGT